MFCAQIAANRTAKTRRLGERIIRLVSALGVAALLLAFQVNSCVFAAASTAHAASAFHGSAHQPTGPRTQDAVETVDAYLHRLGLGNKISVVCVFSGEDQECLRQIDLYRRLLAVPGMDGQSGKLILFTRDGAIPAYRTLKERNLKVHSIGSFPSEAGGLPTELDGLPTALGSIAILDRTGALVKKWNGFPSASQQKEVLELVHRLLQ